MKVIKLTDQKEEAIAFASEIIMNGGIVCLPFDTVYGLACDPKNDEALSKIFELKERPGGKTIGLAASKLEAVESIADLSQENSKFIKDKTPGKFTFIVKAKPSLPVSEQCVKNGTIGIRIPDSELILKLAEKAGGLIAQTSANISGMGNCYSPQDLQIQYGENLNKIDLVIDGGEIKSEGASKIFDLTGESPEIIERN